MFLYKNTTYNKFLYFKLSFKYSSLNIRDIII